MQGSIYGKRYHIETGGKNKHPLRALHPKWRAKVTAIEESKDLMSLSLDELTGNLKVHEMIIKKDSKIVKEKVERKFIALKAKKESSDEECSTSGSKDEECGDPNHLIRECPKPPKDKNQRGFVGGSWSDSGEEDDAKVKDETCLVAHASSEDSMQNDPKDKSLRNKRFALESTGARLIGSKDSDAPKTYDGQPKALLYLQGIQWRFLGYSQNSKAYIILNKYTRKFEESLNVIFDETPPPSKTSPLVDDDLDEEEAIKVTEKKNLENDIVDETLDIDEIVNIKESRNYPLGNVKGKT
ncbi:retrovirus-related pol polyprotein from transposon TNT 1-94 [Tanacetum coccineum]